MASDLEMMTASGGTIVLNGQTFLLKQLSLGDFGQIQAWLRQRMPKPFVVVADALKDLEPLRTADPAAYESCRKDLLLDAMACSKQANGVGAPPEMIEHAMNSPEGISFILWLCIRKCHAEITNEQVQTWLLAEDLTEIKKKLDEIMVFPDDEDEPLDPTKPAAKTATPPATT